MKLEGLFQRVVLSAYFWVFVAFLLSPLVVLVIFAFNDSTTPTFTGTLPVVSQVHALVNSFSTKDSSKLCGALCAGRTTDRGGGGRTSRSGAGGSVA